MLPESLSILPARVSKSSLESAPIAILCLMTAARNLPPYYRSLHVCLPRKKEGLSKQVRQLSIRLKYLIPSRSGTEEEHERLEGLSWTSHLLFTSVFLSNFFDFLRFNLRIKISLKRHSCASVFSGRSLLRRCVCVRMLHHPSLIRQMRRDLRSIDSLLINPLFHSISWIEFHRC